MRIVTLFIVLAVLSLSVAIYAAATQWEAGAFGVLFALFFMWLANVWACHITKADAFY